jgi:hypothetical protein
LPTAIGDHPNHDAIATAKIIRRPRAPIRPDIEFWQGRGAGNPHATCDAAGSGDRATVIPNRARRGKPRTQPRLHLRATALALDPTSNQNMRSNHRIFGRRSCRFKMMSCWRRVRFSNARSERNLKPLVIKDIRRKIIRITI